jgi:ketosteroid isomerase-like protein
MHSQPNERPGDTSAVAMGDVQAAVREYLTALAERDLERCLQCFADDATLTFFTAFKGQKAIEKFHRDRFAADLRIISVDAVEAVGNTVTVDLAVATRKLAAARIPALPGRATIRLEGGKIKTVNLGLSPKLGR